LSSRLGIVTALAAESRPLAAAARRSTSPAPLPEGMLVAVSGMGWSAAAQGAQRLIEAGATALMSWGLAGGLDPALRAGTVVLPREIISSEGLRFPVALHWHAQLTTAVEAACPLSTGSLLSCRAPLISPAEKSDAFRSLAAVAVDMESIAVAQVASSQRLPFIAVRVIVDTAEDSVPPSLTSATTTTGTVRIARMIVGLLRAPSELGAFVRLLLRYRAARRTLVAVARCGALAPLGQRSAAALA
jgi:adenosylhomocysteine nucleosidase